MTSPRRSFASKGRFVELRNLRARGAGRLVMVDYDKRGRVLGIEFIGQKAACGHLAAAVSRVPPREATLPRGQRGSRWRQRGHAMTYAAHVAR
jgi:hypothetical protein